MKIHIFRQGEKVDYDTVENKIKVDRKGPKLTFF